MPTVSVFRDSFFAALGQEYTDEAFDELCFEFGVELDDITSEAEMARKERGAEAGAGLSERTIYKIETYVVTPAQTTITVKPETADVRPYVVCAVLRNIRFTQERYDSFIDLQDKLHQNICRRRTLVSMGTHDLDTVEGPFTYEARRPEEINFVPLSQNRAFRGDELLEFYRTEPSVKHIKPYVDIIGDKERYPVIVDRNGVIMSLPPLINSEHSKISLGTRNVFIEMTATDLTKAHMVLNTLVAMFSEYCEPAFSIEAVRVDFENVEQCASFTSPDMSVREARASLRDICGTIGVPIAADRAAELATKMQLDARTEGEGEDAGIVCRVPATRPDILHACDIVEDVAIAYGYNNVPKTLPQCMTVGREQPINRLTDQLREEVAQAGYTECLTTALCSREDNFASLRREEDGSAAVLANPKTAEFQIVRTTLLAGLIKAVRSNREVSFKSGIKLFEISDVVVMDAAADVGARNVRKLAALYTGPTAGFEIIHGLVDRVMLLLEVPWRASAAATGAAEPVEVKPGRGGYRYFIEEEDDPTFFPRRCARVMLERTKPDAAPETVAIGRFGILHPDVLSNFGVVDYPASAVEIDLTPFVEQ